MPSPYGPSYPQVSTAPMSPEVNVGDDDLTLSERLGLKTHPETSAALREERMRGKSPEERLKILSKYRMARGAEDYSRMVAFMDPAMLQSRELDHVTGQDIMAGQSLPAMTYMETAEEAAQQSLPEAAVPYEVGSISGLGEKGKTGDRSETVDEVPGVGGKAGSVLSYHDLYQKKIAEMHSRSMGPTPSDIEKTHESLYGKAGTIYKTQMNLDDLQAQQIKLKEQDQQIKLAAEAEKFHLMGIDREEIHVREQISGDFSELAGGQYEKFKKTSDDIQRFIDASRTKWENEDPISAFRMFDWFSKEYNEDTKTWEESFQWSGFATSVASLAAVAGNVFLNMATAGPDGGKVPLFAINLLTTAMDNDLSAQKAQISAEGNRANMYGIMLDAYKEESLALNHYRLMQLTNAELYFKRLRADIQTSDPAQARGLAALENMVMQEKNKVQQARQKNMQEFAKDFAEREVSRLAQAGSAASRLTVMDLQHINALATASAAAAKRAENPDGNWEMNNFEKVLVNKKGNFAKSVNEVQRLAQAFIQRYGMQGAAAQWWGTEAQDMLGIFGQDHQKQKAFTELSNKITAMAQEIARSKDTGNLSKQEQEWWFKLGPNMTGQPMGIVFTKLATLAHSSRLQAIDAWSIANNATRQQYGNLYSAAFGIESPVYMDAIVSKNRESLRGGTLPFTNLDLTGYPEDMKIDMETALGGVLATLESKDDIGKSGSGLSYRTVAPEGFPIDRKISGEISKELQPEARPKEGIEGAPEGGYVYLPTTDKDKEGNIVKARFTRETGEAVSKMSTYISRMTNGLVNVLPSGKRAGVRTLEEHRHLEKMHENWEAEQKGGKRPHKDVGASKWAPEKHGGHAQKGRRTAGKHEAIDFTVHDSKDSNEYRALIKLGPYFGIFPTLTKDGEHPHLHHFESRPEDALTGTPPKMDGYGGVTALTFGQRPGTAERTVDIPSAPVVGEFDAPKYDAFVGAGGTKPLAPYQRDPEAIKQLLQHQQAFARGRGLAPKRATPAWPTPPPLPPEVYNRPAPAPAWPTPPPPPDRVPPVYGRQNDPTQRSRGLKGLRNQWPRTPGPWGK